MIEDDDSSVAPDNIDLEALINELVILGTDVVTLWVVDVMLLFDEE